MIKNTGMFASSCARGGNAGDLPPVPGLFGQHQGCTKFPSRNECRLTELTPGQHKAGPVMWDDLLALVVGVVFVRPSLF
jgi:hypothetical protein